MGPARRSRLIWYIVIIAALGLAIAGLRRPYVGCGLALLGAMIAAGLALGTGALYLKFGFTPPRPKNDSDWSGILMPMLCIVFIPAGSGLLGFVVGIVYAYWRERSVPARLSPKPEPIDP